MENEFKVGVGREKITPPLGTLLYGYPYERFAESVHDDLYLSAFAISSGERTVIMITADLCAMGTEEVAELQRIISESAGVDGANVTFSATHTHSGPCTRRSVGWGQKNSEYINGILKPAALRAAKYAVDNMKDAVMGVGVTDSEVGINRRERNFDGEVILGQNPNGIFSKKMTVIAFRDESGEGIGCMVHYGAHGTSAGDGCEITRDWPGVMCDALERETGMPTAFFAGQTGDTGPRLSNGKTVGDITYTEAIGALAGLDAVRAYKTIKEYSKPTLSVHRDVIKLPYEPLMSYEKAKESYIEYSSIENPKGRHIKAAAKYRDVMDVYEKKLPILEAFEYPVTLISLGCVAFAPFPFEVFTEIALRLARHSPFTHTLVLNNTGGSFAYFPSKGEILLGGYEVFMFEHFGTFNFTRDADTAAVKEYTRGLLELHKQS